MIQEQRPKEYRIKALILITKFNTFYRKKKFVHAPKNSQDPKKKKRRRKETNIYVTLKFNAFYGKKTFGPNTLIRPYSSSIPNIYVYFAIHNACSSVFSVALCKNYIEGFHLLIYGNH